MALRSLVLTFILGLLHISSFAQGSAMNAPQAPDLFDFWVGDWQVSWSNADGTQGKGRNHIAKLLDGTVLEETFAESADSPPPRLLGKSLTVLEKKSGVWRQAWADNQGGFFAFTGSVDGSKRIFTTETNHKDGKAMAQRMVFHSIEKDRFTWDWEGTSDGGASWNLLWRIQYQR